jgi:hypothetical protein
MGKRELLLIAGFVLAGIGLYYATAPAAAPGDQGFSLSRIIESLRREVRGNQASAELTTTGHHAVAATTNELRVLNGGQELTITGEDRQDIASDFRVRSSGYDQAEAESLAKSTLLEVKEAGGTIIVNIEYPRPGRQQAYLQLRVPSRLRLQVPRSGGKLSVSDVAEVDVREARGETTVKQINGRVAMTHRGGNLAISDVASLKLTTRGSDVRVQGVRGDTTLMLQAGELRGSAVTGPIDLESNSTEVVLEQLEKAKGIRASAVNGKLSMRGLRSETRIDGRNAEIDVTLDAPAPVSVFNEGDESITLTLPPGGFALDAVASDGHVTMPPDSIEVKSLDKEQRATGNIGGGGPTITLRATRGDIVVRPRESAKPER